MSEKSVVGDLINFRGLVYAPINENGVIFLFGKIADDLNMYIEEIKPGYPDCIARRFIGKGWERVSIEFEFQSKNFVQHGHDPQNCDIIVCWEHNWKDCPLEVIELKTEIQELENYPISKPQTSDSDSSDNSIEKIYEYIKPQEKVKQWYSRIFEELTKNDNTIWAKIGKKYIGIYSPEKAFVSVSIKKQSIKYECFSRGLELDGAKICNVRFSPRWNVFSVKTDSDIKKAVNILIQSQKLMKEAIKAGELTSYFSGGEPVGSTRDVIESENEEE